MLTACCASAHERALNSASERDFDVAEPLSDAVLCSTLAQHVTKMLQLYSVVTSNATMFFARKGRVHHAAVACVLSPRHPWMDDFDSLSTNGASVSLY